MLEEARRRASGAVVPPRSVADGVRDLIDRLGERGAGEQLLVGRQTVARLAASLPCRRSTVEVVRTRLGLEGDAA
jgi:hypothetical protein